MVVYADELMGLNGVVNYLLLLSCARLGGAGIHWPRLALAAALGAVYALLAMLPALGFLVSWGMKAAVCLAMALIAFGREQGLVRLTALFFALSLTYAGVILLAANLLGTQAVVRNGIVCCPVSFRAMVLTAGATYAVTGTLLSRCIAHGPETLGTVTLRLGENSVRAQTLLDTGSGLRDPAGNQAVVLINWDLARELLPKNAALLVTEESAAHPAELLPRLAASAPALKLQLLPYRALGGGGLLLAFRCDDICLSGRKNMGRWAAISPARLSEEGQYRALVGSG